MKFLFNTFFYEPLYNFLVWLTDVIPGGEFGIAIVVLTFVIKFILLPLSHRFTKTQRKMRDIQGEVKDIQTKLKDNKEEQTRQILALYKKHGVNPFSGFLLILIQLPVLWAIYRVIIHGLPFDPNLLYSFVSAPETVSTMFLGLDLASKSIIMAILVGATQFVQMWLAIPPVPRDKKKSETLSENFARSMQFNMRYVMPLVIGFISLSFPAALALYWTVNNLFTIIHEYIVKKQAEAIAVAPPPADANALARQAGGTTAT